MIANDAKLICETSILDSGNLADNRVINKFLFVVALPYYRSRGFWSSPRTDISEIATPGLLRVPRNWTFHARNQTFSWFRRDQGPGSRSRESSR